MKTPFKFLRGRVDGIFSGVLILPCVNVCVVVGVTHEILDWKLCQRLEYINSLRAVKCVVFVPCKCSKLKGKIKKIINLLACRGAVTLPE